MEERKARVMLANDEAHIRELLNLTLTSLGAEVGRNRAQTPVPEIVWISLCHAAGTA